MSCHIFHEPQFWALSLTVRIREPRPGWPPCIFHSLVYMVNLFPSLGCFQSNGMRAWIDICPECWEMTEKSPGGLGEGIPKEVTWVCFINEQETKAGEEYFRLREGSPHIIHFLSCTWQIPAENNLETIERKREAFFFFLPSLMFPFQPLFITPPPPQPPILP